MCWVLGKVPLPGRQKEWVAEPRAWVLSGSKGRRGWKYGVGEGEGRSLDPDTKTAGEGYQDWLLFTPGGPGLGTDPPAAGNVPV